MQVSKDLISIIYDYVYGFFIPDLLTIFPFELVSDIGPQTKLFRLFRIPKILKMLTPAVVLRII